MKDRQVSFLLRNSSILQRLFFLALLSIAAMSAYAQGKNVSGTVLDKSGESVIGASVLVKGTTNGTITDLNGKFTLSNVDDDAIWKSTLSVTKHNLYPVRGSSVFNVTLLYDTEVLDEVVVVGYGTAKKSDVTGALTQVSSKTICERPVQNVLPAMQGKAAEVQISTNNRPG